MLGERTEKSFESRVLQARSSGKLITVGMADMQISRDPKVVLVTYALGSCIGVAIHDPIRKVGGLIHYMLPLSKTAPEKAAAKPAMFADVGVPLLFEKVYKLGGVKKDLVVKVAGGGEIYDGEGTFKIGKRNFAILRKLFWKNGIFIAGEDVGGNRSRTMRLFLDTGRVTVTNKRTEVEL